MKKYLKVLVVLIIAAASLLVYRLYTNSKTVKGEKSVVVQIYDDRNGEHVELLNKSFKTDAKFLGELLDEISSKDIKFTFEGSKTDPYGRMIVGIKDVKQDPANGHYWMYDSKTNKECVAAGFCTGADMQPIYNQDTFIFTIE